MLDIDEMLEEVARLTSDAQQELLVREYVGRAVAEPTLTETLENFASLLFQRGFVELAFLTYTELYDLHPRHRYAKELAYRYSQYNRWEEALLWAEKANLKQFDYKMEIIIAQSQVAQDHLPQAIAIYKNLVKHYPQEGKAYEALGDIYQQQGNVEQAEKLFRAVFEYLPDYSNYKQIRLKLLALVTQKELVDFNQIQLLELAEKLAVDTEEEFYAFAVAYGHTYNYDKAIHYAKLAYDADKDKFDYALLLAQLYQLNQQVDAAKQMIDGLIRMVPMYDETILDVAQLAWELNELNQGLVDKLVAIKDMVSDVDDAYLLVECVVAYYLQQDDAQQALTYLLVFEDNLLEGAYLSYYFAKTFETLGNVDQAYNYYEEALYNLVGDEATIQDYVSFMLSQEDYDGAMTTLTEVEGSIYDTESLKELRQTVKKLLGYQD